MSSELDDFADIQITEESSTALQEGFGIPIILSADAPVSYADERIRYYEDLDGLEDDGYDPTTPEWKAANKLTSQDKSIEQFAIGIRTRKPTQKFRVTPLAVNNAKYPIRLGSQTVQVTGDSSTTVAEVTAALKTAIDALSLPLTTTDGSTYLDITLTNPGDWLAVESLDVSKLKIAQTHADPGVATDLSEILTVDGAWYTILNLFNSKAEVEAIGAWVQSQKKVFVAESLDTDIIAVTYSASSNSDIATRLKDLGLSRTMLHYHPANDAFLDAAISGKCLPLQPGSETWHAKKLANVSTTKLTSTHRVNLKAKNCGWFYGVAGVGVTAQGKMSNGQYMDSIRGIDWLEARMAERIFFRESNSDKIPYTNDGATIMGAEVRAQLQEGNEVGLIAPNSWNVIIPDVDKISPTVKGTRQLPNLKFTAKGAGAIHGVTVRGTVTL